MFFRNVTWIQWLCNLEDPSLTKISVDHITQASVDLKSCNLMSRSWVNMPFSETWIMTPNLIKYLGFNFLRNSFRYLWTGKWLLSSETMLLGIFGSLV